ncbi:MAG TPA: AtaL-like protein [Burkholderiaceae bacterium]|nr:AtaL-like protein [Burkholderiaceae bacterium]
MRFEHLVQINDPLVPLLDTLTRAQLWSGLALFAHEPMRFNPVLEDARVISQGADAIERELNFGTHVVRDRVTLATLRELTIAIEPGTRWPASRLTVRIEEPSNDALFLRFVHEWPEDAPRTELDEQTIGMREQAYKLHHLDIVARIRDLGRGGLLG